MSEQSDGPTSLNRLEVSNGAAAGPVLRVTWAEPCEASSGETFPCTSAWDTLSLASGLEREVLTVRSPWNGSVINAAGTPSGELWQLVRDPMANNILEKRSTEGELLFEQTLLRRAGTATSSIDAGPSRLPSIAVLPDESLIASVTTVGKYGPESTEDHLWRFDTRGNATYHAVSEGGESARIVVDGEGRVLFFRARGDLEIRRLRVEDNRFDFQAHISKEGYFSLSPESATVDAAGNVFISLLDGTRSAPHTTLCKVPLEGELVCYALGNLGTSQLVAAGDGAVFAAAVVPPYEFSRPEQAPVERHLVLQRYDVP